MSPAKKKGMSFALSAIIVGIGLIGEYVGRTYQIAQGRPRYILRKLYDTQSSGHQETQDVWYWSRMGISSEKQWTLQWFSKICRADFEIAVARIVWWPSLIICFYVNDSQDFSQYRVFFLLFPKIVDGTGVWKTHGDRYGVPFVRNRRLNNRMIFCPLIRVPFIGTGMSVRFSSVCSVV